MDFFVLRTKLEMTILKRERQFSENRIKLLSCCCALYLVFIERNTLWRERFSSDLTDPLAFM